MNLRIFRIGNHLAFIFSFYWSLCLAQDITTSVTAVAGSKALLPCNTTPPTIDDGVSLILWYKDESTTPIYSLDARKGNINQARHASSDLLSNRAYLQTQQNTATLHLQRLSEDDMGEYRCRVDFRKARTRNFVVFLKIIVPPSKPVIRDINGEPVNSLLGPLNEGDSLTLHCTASSGIPKGQLAWFRETLQLISTAEPTNFDLTTLTNRNTSSTTTTNEEMLSSSLRIERLTREHLMAVYSCRASNNNLTEPAVTEVTVDLNLRPLTVTIDSDRHPLSAENTVQLHCHSNGSRPAAMLHWYKGVERLRSSKTRHSPDGNTSYSILNFTPSLSDMGAILSCSAENQLIPTSTIQDTWKLDIHYVPQVTLKLGSKLRYSNIQEGNDVYFECIVKANPNANEIRWWFEGAELRTNATERIIISGNSLVLQKVSRNLRGRYTCSASNSQGEGQSNNVHLRIQHAPICSPNQKQTKYALGRLESVKIQCDVLADPPNDLVFTWYFNGTQIMTTNEERSTPNNLINNALEFNENGNLTHNYVSTSYATYKPRTENDYGSLICVARNSIGKQEVPCEFTLVPAGSPDPLRACSVRNVTDHSIIVGCLPGYNGGLKQKFILTLQELTTEQLTSTHQHLLNKHLMDKNKYPSILTTEELEDYSNNEISSLNSIDKSIIIDNLDSKLDKSSRKRAKSKINTKMNNNNMINLLEDKLELDEQQEHSKENNEDNFINELNQNAINDQNTIDLEPGGTLNFTSDRSQFYVKGLRSGSTYLCSLHAVNSRGISRAVVLVAQTLAAPESMNRKSDGNMWQFTFNPFLMLLIAIVSIVVFIACIVLITIRIRLRHNRRDKSGHNETNNDKLCTTPLRNTKEDICDMCTFDDKCPDIIPSSKDEKLYTSSILQPNSTSSGSVRNNYCNYSNHSSNYNLHYANTTCDNFSDANNQIDPTPSTKLLDDKFNEDSEIKGEQEKCYFANNNLNKIYYHAHSLINKSDSVNCTSSSMQLSNNSTTNSLINSINKEEDLNNPKLNQALSIPTINYFSSNTNISNGLNSQSTNQQIKSISPTNNTLKSLNGITNTTNKIYQDAIELKQTSNVRFQQQLKNQDFLNLKTEYNQFKSSLNSCSGSCNQLIHGNTQQQNILKSQTLFNNNIYSNQNRNSFAAYSSTNGYLNYLNRFNVLRNSMISTNELLSNNTIPSSSIYSQQQFTHIASLKQQQRNSLAWSPIYWPVNNNNINCTSNGLNTLNKINNMNNINSKLNNNKSNGTNGDLNFENSLPVCSTPIKEDFKIEESKTQQTILQCSNCSHLNTSSSLNQTKIDEIDKEKNEPNKNQTNSNHEINLVSNLDFSNLNNFLNSNNKQDQSIEEEDKISLYDNVDNDCLKPLLDRSEKLLCETEINKTGCSSSNHVRLIDNCREDIQHSLKMNNKLCL